MEQDMTNPSAGELLELKVSAYPSNRNTKRMSTPSLGRVLEHIREPNEHIRERLEQAHRLYLEVLATPKGGEQHNRAKRAYQRFKLENLPVFVPRGICREGERRDSGFERVNPLVIVDLDGLGGQMETVREKLCAIPSCLAVFRSPSGDGLKALLAVRERFAYTNENHRHTWEILRQVVRAHTDWEPDPSGKNRARTCYASHDPSLWVREAEETVELLEIPVPRPLARRREEGRDSLLAKQMAQDLSVPDDYNHWYGMAVSMKNAGLSLSEVEAWSARGRLYEEGEIAKRWDRMQQRTYTNAMRHLAKELRDTFPRRAEGENGSLPRDIDGQIGLGETIGRQMTREFRYEPGVSRWLEWIGCHWQAIGGAKPRAVEDAVRQYVRQHAEELEGRIRYEVHETQNGRFERRETVKLDENSVEEMLRSEPLHSGLRAGAERRDRKNPEPQLATPDGVWFPRKSELEPHDPTKHDTRGVTAGRYRPGEWEALEKLPEWDELPDHSGFVEVACAVVRRLMSNPKATALYQAPGQGLETGLLAQALGQRALPVPKKIGQARIAVGSPGAGGTAEDPGPGGTLELGQEMRDWSQDMLDAVVTCTLRQRE